jgi:hypothetical protein
MRKLMLMTLSILLFVPLMSPQIRRARATNCPPGQSQTFTSRWFSPNNHFYATSISVSPDGVCRHRPTGFFTGPEKRCFPISRVQSVAIRPGFASDDVIIESTGGGEPLIGDGMASRDAKQITALILSYQRAEAECRMNGDR